MPKTSRYDPEELNDRQKKQRTILNWKKQFDVKVPIECFDEFKSHKKYYLKLCELNPVLVGIFMRMHEDPQNKII